MIFAPTRIALMKLLHVKPNINSIHKLKYYPYPNHHCIKLNVEPCHNPNPNSLEK